MPKSLLEAILIRLDEIEDPVIGHREIERFSDAERDNVLAAGILKETTSATEIAGSRGNKLSVCPTARGLWGVPDEDDDYHEPVPLVDEDTRQYMVSVPAFADALRKANGISGTGFVYDDGLLSLGQKVVKKAGSLDVYLSFPNLDEAEFRSRCQRLKQSRGVQNVAVLTPQGMAMSAETRQLLDSIGVVIAPLLPAFRKGSLAVNWKVVSRQMAAKEQPSQKDDKRSWTQQDLDNAILKHKAERAHRYGELVEAVRRGERGARQWALKAFGRNAIARALGVRSPAMVSNSEAWVEIAKELKIPLARDKARGTRRTRQAGKIGVEIALEQQALAVKDETDPSAPLRRAEREETLGMIRKLPKKEAVAILEKYEAGDVTDDQARKQVRILLNQE